MRRTVSLVVGVGVALSAVGGSSIAAEHEDEKPPKTRITSGPSGPTNDPTPAFAFTSSEGHSKFKCRLDVGRAARCTSPHTLAPVSEGPHVFRVFAIDKAHNKDRTPAQRAFTVDTIPPAIVGLVGPLDPSGSTNASFSYGVTDGTVQCILDAGTVSVCNSSSAQATGLPDGSRTFTVRATDAAGNVGSANWTWTVDTVPPDTQINSGPSGPTSNNDPSFGFSAESGATFQCKLDAGPTFACTSPRGFTDLVDGTHTFTVFACDAVGNCDATPAQRTFTVDTVPPAPVTNAGFGSPSAGTCRITFNLPAEAAYAVALRKTTNDISGPNDPAATSLGHITSPFDDSGLAGATTYYYAVFAVDAAGNTSSAVNGQCTPN